MSACECVWVQCICENSGILNVELTWKLSYNTLRLCTPKLTSNQTVVELTTSGYLCAVPNGDGSDRGAVVIPTNREKHRASSINFTRVDFFLIWNIDLTFDVILQTVALSHMTLIVLLHFFFFFSFMKCNIIKITIQTHDEDEVGLQKRARVVRGDDDEEKETSMKRQSLFNCSFFALICITLPYEFRYQFAFL